MSSTISVSTTVNDRPHTIMVEPYTTLLDALCEDYRATGKPIRDLPITVEKLL